MKKLIVLLVLLLLSVSCGKKEIGEEKDIRLTFINNEDSYGTNVKVRYLDGIILVKKADFYDLVKKVSWFDISEIEKNEYKVSLGQGEKEIIIDYNNNKIKILNNTYENKSYLEELKTKYYDYLEQDRIFDNYLAYTKNRLKYYDEEIEIELEGKYDDYFDLNEIFYLSTLNFLLKENSTKEYVVAKDYYYPNVAFQNTSTLNNRSLKVIKSILNDKSKYKLSTGEGLKYLEENEEEFYSSFKHHLNETIERSGDNHFGIVSNKELESKEERSIDFDFKVIDGVNYLEYKSFSQNQIDQLYKVFGEMDREKDLIIDMRGNYGGKIINMFYLISLISDKDISIFERIKDEKVELVLADMSTLSYDGEIVLLVDKDNYSAGTIFPSILRDNNLATIIGEKTYGGSVSQVLIYLPNGLIVTSDSVETLDKNFDRINNGIEVDIEVGDRDGVEVALEYLKR